MDYMEFSWPEYGASLAAEPPGKPKNTGVGSLSLFQGIFPIQELNWGLLHCRRVLFFFHGSKIALQNFVVFCSQILYQLPGKPLC